MAGGEDLPETTTVEQDTEPQATVKTNRRGRPKTTESQENGAAKPKQTADQTRRRSIRQSEVNGSDPPDEDASNQDGSRDGQQGISRPRSRRGITKQAEARLEVDHDAEQEDQIPESSSNKRGRRRKEPEQPEPKQQDEEQNNEPTQRAPRGRRKRTRPTTENVEAEEAQEEEETAAQTRNRRKGKNREVEPDVERPIVEETQERVEETQKSKEDKARRRQPQGNGESSRRRGRPSLGKGQARPEAETAEPTEIRPEASTEPDQPAKRRRGRRSGVAPEDNTTSRQPVSRRRQQDDEQEPRRRGGTVAITVHRLANTHILDSTHAASDPSDNEQDSADELEALGKNFPSRNGVNAADVLSQICKEILDKHLTTLDNNIANDAANQAKRSEYARQRKTIEAYGTQLEGRLFELSELLNSNFSLGVQLKKAKREAAEMRNRLLEVRQQRHEITLRMDAVRRKHGEEENAKMVCPPLSLLQGNSRC